MKTLNLDISKRLNDEGLLDNIETEYKFHQDTETKEYSLCIGNYVSKNCPYIKTLTLEESIELLPKSIETEDLEYYLFYDFVDDRIYYTEDNCGSFESELLVEIFGNSILESIEKMITYLLDNNIGFDKKTK